MPGHSTHQPHGSGVRGLSNLRSADVPDAIDALGGRFGRMFDLPPAAFDENDLLALSNAMTNGEDEPTSKADPEESDIGAAYTYFGQFIDHDLTFDPSTFNQQKSDPKALVDFRTPRFDLDNVYGRGPGDQPYLYDGPKLTLGQKLFTVERNPKARDVPRAEACFDGTQRAIIGDPRNDENVIVSQLQGMFQRFHNGVVNRLTDHGQKKDVPFAEIQLEVRRHYQWAVLHDFLPKIVARPVLDGISVAIADPDKSFAKHPAQLRFYTFAEPVMPVEFSVAAYRIGHSMVRPGYRVNEFTDALKIFDHKNPTNGLNAFGNFPKSWGIDWQRFVDLGIGPKTETDDDRVQRAYKIDTSLVDPLFNLPFSVAGDEARVDPRKLSLAFRNLLRGQILKLPSGQAVAEAMRVEVLKDNQIFIFKAEDGSKEDDGEDGKKAPTITAIGSAFKQKCPLWVYVLAESRRNFYHGKQKQARLGPVGGTIVAEVFLALLMRDRDSILNAPDWRPHKRPFGLPELLHEALMT